MHQECLDHTLQPTALVHEVYLGLFPGCSPPKKSLGRIAPTSCAICAGISAGVTRFSFRVWSGGWDRRVFARPTTSHSG